MLPEEARASMLYAAWDLANKAEKESAEKMRAHTDRAWKARGEAEKEAEAALWREKVLAGPDISLEELKALEEEAKAAEERFDLAVSANHASRAAMYESQKIFKEAKKFYADRKELAAQEKSE